MTEPASTLAVVVVISGSGSNLQALIDAVASGAPFRIVGVIANRPDAQGLRRAQAAEIPTRVIDQHDFRDREAFDSALAQAIDAFDPGLVVLAGFMRILGEQFVDRYAGRMLNIHPSLLPEFQGLHTHRRALQSGVTRHGASVHFVNATLDGGPVVAQTQLDVLADDTEQSLAARVLTQEHRLLPLVVRWFAEGRLALCDQAIWFDGKPMQLPIQC